MSNISGDDDVQVPQTSSPASRVISSSPLKADTPYTSNGGKDEAAILREKFVYKPNMGAGASAASTKSVAEQLAELQQEYPDFSSTLIQAVFKSNASDMGNARARLDRIKAQRSTWSRTPSLNSGSAGASTTSNSTRRLNSIANSTTKITVDKPKSSIFDRYSTSRKRSKNDKDDDYVEDASFNFNPELLAKIRNADASKKKRKLVRGSELDAAKSKMLETRAKKMMKDEGDGDDSGAQDSDMDENSGSDDEYEDRAATAVNIDDQILEFLNTADPLDLADLADTNFDKAQVIVASRPFAHLDDFVCKEYLTEEEKNKKEADSKKKSSRRNRSQKTESERFLEKIAQSIRGYNAIDSLLKTCSGYGISLEKQMAKWGIDLKEVDEQSAEANEEADGTSTAAGSADNNGMAIMTVDDDEENAVVEGFDETDVSATPTPAPTAATTPAAPTTNDGDEGDSDFEPEEDDELVEDEEDEDYEEAPQRSSRIRANGGQARVMQRKGPIKFFKGKPRLLSPDIELKDYQQMGINWLNLLYHNQMSCILADDMGLGKTCQVISFLAYLKQINQPGPNLIVVPSSTLENWLREFKKFCPALKVEPYYGSLNERADLREYLERTTGEYDVIVTTYNLAAGNKYDIAFLRGCSFNVVVYDEGHMLKNSTSERFAKLMRIHAKFRLLLTGTPLQNNLRELMSLLEFIMPQLFVSQKESLATIFKQRARTTDDNGGHNPLLVQEAIERAKTMMKPFILRRHKSQVLKHLPAKHSRVVLCDMTDAQRRLYDREVATVKLQRKQRLLGETPTVAAADRAKNLIMTLRKASIHPLLFRDLYDDKKIDKMSDAILDEPEYSENGNREYIREDMSCMTDFELHRLCERFPRTLSKYTLRHDEWMNSGKVTQLASILKDAIGVRGEKVLVFSLFTQVLDILEPVLSTLGYRFLRLDGSTAVNERQSLIDTFYEDASVPVFLLSTKAGGFGINLVCANHVVLFDQSFNPHDDRQAADRAHRVGQTREVHVSTLITRDSIEEQIHRLARNKLALDVSVGGNVSGSAAGSAAAAEASGSASGDAALESKMSSLLENIICADEPEST